MSNPNKSLTKIIIISVIMVLVIAVLLYLLPMAFKKESDGVSLNVNPINKIMEKITEDSVDKNNNNEMINDEGEDLDLAQDELQKEEEKINEKRDSYGNNRRYLESSVEVCESGEFLLYCEEETEFEFSDETGCGCELTKEAILAEQEILKQREKMEANQEENIVDEVNAEENMPTVCTMEYSPVCGELDGEYQTFSNDCMAEGSGVLDYTEGECE